MAIILRFPARPPARPAVADGGTTAAVVILPCVRREPLGAVARTSAAVLEQLQA